MRFKPVPESLKVAPPFILNDDGSVLVKVLQLNLQRAKTNLSFVDQLFNTVKGEDKEITSNHREKLRKNRHRLRKLIKDLEQFIQLNQSQPMLD